jgi:(p)ppGpp synthase/HD superfamily hydrolase
MFSIYTDKIRRAIKFASKTHNQYQQQKRKGKLIPYITHPLTVGLILSLAKASEDVIVAGVLHDTIEDSPDYKKVEPDMIKERFGLKVLELVLSVTEDDKSFSWKERKAKALKNVESFNEHSLLLKSADVLANYSELIDDYMRYGDETFVRFSASKEEIINHQLKVISSILFKWKENPLYDDLKILSKNLKLLLSDDA